MLGILLVLIWNFFIRIIYLSVSLSVYLSICLVFLQFGIKPFWFIFILHHCERTFTKWFYSYAYNPRTFDITQLLIPMGHCFESSSWHNWNRWPGHIAIWTTAHVGMFCTTTWKGGLKQSQLPTEHLLIFCHLL